MAVQSDWQIVGRQRFLVSGDLLWWEVCGDIEVPEISAIFSTALTVQAAHGYTLMLITAVGDWSFPPPARRFLGQFHRQHQAVGASAIVGASPTMTLFIDMVLRAVGLVSGHRPKTRFFLTLQEARAWLEEQRALGQRGLLER